MKKCYAVSDYCGEEILKVFLSKARAEAYAQELRGAGTVWNNNVYPPQKFVPSICVEEIEFDDEQVYVLDTLVKHHLGYEFEACAGEMVDDIHYQYYYNPLTEMSVKCWIDSNGNFRHEKE